MNYKEIFEEIYRKGVWNDNRADVPLSGPGSSVESARNALILIDDFISDNNVKSVADLGCGDLTWVKSASFFNNDEIHYCGVDVVDSVIESHKKSYPRNIFPNKIFINEDITKYIIQGVDLVILRDVIFHLKKDDINMIFKNIKNRFKYIAVTSSSNEVNDDNMNQWFFAERNIHKDPFNVGENFINYIYEEQFNRNFYIYRHGDFYLNQSYGLKSVLKNFAQWFNKSRLMA